MEETKKQKKKYKLWELIFISFSGLFIIGCFIFYGFRLIKYYKIYNPKIDDEQVELVMNAIVKNTKIVYEGTGLYRLSGQYIYKGKDVNNYIRYSGFTWRIIKFNKDGSLDVVLDDNINMLKWGNETNNFVESDIYKYLNNYFYKLLNSKNLSNTIVCNDIITDLNSITCNDKVIDSYVRLVSVSEYLNSKADGSYLETGSNIWLGSRNEDTIWNINEGNLSTSEPINMYYIKPVVTLKNSTKLLSGNGTKDEPYVIEESKLGVGSYVLLDDDLWIIYDKYQDNYKLSLADSLSNKERYNPNSTKFDLKTKGTLAYYLNNEYYESLSYKNKLVETIWYDGDYDSYEDVFKSTVSAKVGILNVADLKLVNTDNFYLMTPNSNDKIYLYSTELIDSKPNLQRSIVPTISLSKIEYNTGSGTLNDPYVLEV